MIREECIHRGNNLGNSKLAIRLGQTAECRTAEYNQRLINAVGLTLFHELDYLDYIDKGAGREDQRHPTTRAQEVHLELQELVDLHRTLKPDELVRPNKQLTRDLGFAERVAQGKRLTGAEMVKFIRPKKVPKQVSKRVGWAQKWEHQ